jgi:endonuclease-3 related protein
MDLEELLSRLEARYEAGSWWPSSSAFEVMVGAILTQQTNWRNVERALQLIREGSGLEVSAMASTPLEELEEMVRPAGFYRQKAARLKLMARYLVEMHQGDPEGILGKDAEDARNELLSLPGVGKETADSILIFAGGRPKFVAAAYTSRILSRTGVLDSTDYDEIQSFVESRLPPDTMVLGGLYARMVILAKEHCLSTPRCEGCPLSDGCALNRR